MADASIPGSSDGVDGSTHANIADVVQKHLVLDLEADFSAKRLMGRVDLVCERTNPLADRLVLDTAALDIKAVSLVGSDGESPPATISPLEWKTGPASAALGTPLTIRLPPKQPGDGDGLRVRVEYSTTSGSVATQWLPPAQTAGKTHPYLFTQCQAIHARSLVPCQDTCAAKVTYEARITAPKPLRALMSALGNGDPPVATTDATATYAFKQPVAMASYLIAIAVGDLRHEAVGPRTGVWAEPGVVSAAAHEFAEMETMLTTGELVCGDYVWGRYDVLCMPPSFPYGGMENPCLTFVTPTLLAGDRSLADVVVHEITHSWTGNLVTNKTWKHFWLNEGWTMFVQRKIVAHMQGLAVADLTAIGGMKALADSVSHFGADHDYTTLLPTLGGVDPDDAFSSVPYEKGHSLLRHLETVVGGPDVFAPFVKAYVAEFAHKTLTSADFRAFFTRFFADKGVDTSSVDWVMWLTKPGMPPVDNVFDDSLAKAAEALKHKWMAGKGQGCAATDLGGWRTGQTLVFLDSLQADDCKAALTPELLRAMGALYGFSESGNAEIRFRWAVVCIRAGMAEAVPDAVALATEQGRMKFTRPLYRELYASEVGKAAALEAFDKHRDSYHPICSKMVAKDLGLAA